MNLVAGPDFLGYESSYYDIRLKKDTEITIVFRSAQLHQEGKVLRQPQPRVHLFQVQEGTRFVRLMYLLRLSSADHDMAVVSGKTIGELEGVTNAVKADPVHGCAAPTCFWIPSGIAVHRYQPEKGLHGRGRAGLVPSEPHGQMGIQPFARLSDSALSLIDQEIRCRTSC